MLALAVIAISFCYEVVARYFFNAPTIWASPFASYGLCAAIFLAMPELTRTSSHISLNFLDDALSRERALRMRRIIRVVAARHLRAGCLDHGASRMERLRARHRHQYLLSDPEMVAFRHHPLRHGQLRHLFSPPSRAAGDRTASPGIGFMTWWVALSTGRRPAADPAGDRRADLHQLSAAQCCRRAGVSRACRLRIVRRQHLHHREYRRRWRRSRCSS